MALWMVQELTYDYDCRDSYKALRDQNSYPALNQIPAEEITLQNLAICKKQKEKNALLSNDCDILLFPRRCKPYKLKHVAENWGVRQGYVEAKEGSKFLTEHPSLLRQYGPAFLSPALSQLQKRTPLLSLTQLRAY
eukprot:1432614-Rhodomonas_salina.1